MKSYFDEIVILVLQLIVFYAFPLLAVESNSSGMIVIVILATFMASVALGGISKKKLKYYYPIAISVLFIPAIHIYNTEFLLIHTLWCFASSLIGVVIGHIIVNR